MLWQLRVVLIASFAALSACSKDEKKAAEYEGPPSCSPQQAQTAAYENLTAIFTGIVDPELRDATCIKLDDLMRDENDFEGFKKYSVGNCEWRMFGDTESPSTIARSFLEPRGDTLSTLCDWERKDAARASQRMHDEGAAILNSLPQDEREEIQREWDSYAPNR